MTARNRSIVYSMFISLFTIGIFLSGLILYSPTQASPQATFSVNSVSDTDDGTCDGAHCSLREAINAANNAPGADTITFALSPSSTITLTGSQLPHITDTLTIDGSTAVSLTISGNNLTRTFMVGAGTAVTITTLTIKDGRAIYGGAIYNDGGIITLQNSALQDNLALLGGGGIYNDGGTLLVTDSTYQDNTAEIEGGAIHTTPGSTISIDNTDFLANTAEVVFPYPSTSGGAIANYGIMTINNSAFTNNGALAYDDPNYPTFSASSSGGGIVNHGTLSVHGTTFNNNLSLAVAPYLRTVTGSIFNSTGGYSSRGGGIANYGMLTISNSTFSYNRADVAETFNNNAPFGIPASGGGINNGNTMTITNSTFTANTTTIITTDGTPITGSGGGINNSGTMTIQNTIVANSDDSDDCVNSGTILINNSNLVEDGSCSPLLTGDPLLGPLQDNGGPTWTHALAAPSPAIDIGDDVVCAAPPVSNLDQRGVIRPLDGDGDGKTRCDIGAYEYDGPPPDRSLLPAVFRD